MDNYNINALIEQSLNDKKYIELNDEVIYSMTEKEIEYIVDNFGKNYLIKLPEKEIDFFNWLKDKDINVWNDIWEDDYVENSIAPYLVTVNLLPFIAAQDGRGYPICDLQKNDNYFFTLEMMPDEEGKIIIDAAIALLQNNKNLIPAQLLAMEISIAPIDIWHFAYKYGISLSTAKDAVNSLIEDNALVHLKEREHLTPFIHI